MNVTSFVSGNGVYRKVNRERLVMFLLIWISIYRLRLCNGHISVPKSCKLFPFLCSFPVILHCACRKIINSRFPK